MIRSRAGWKIVTLIVVFLILRAIGFTIFELRIASGGQTVFRLVCLAGWIGIVVCIGFGLEWARFVAVMLLTLGSAFAVAVLLDGPLLEDRFLEHELTILRTDLLVFIGTNLVVIPLLAFFKPVRSFFAKVPNMRIAPPNMAITPPNKGITPLDQGDQIRVASDQRVTKLPPSGAAEWRQVNPARSERKQR